MITHLWSLRNCSPKTLLTEKPLHLTDMDQSCTRVVPEKRAEEGEKTVPKKKNYLLSGQGRVETRGGQAGKVFDRPAKVRTKSNKRRAGRKSV
jgi:hypothetical protein